MSFKSNRREFVKKLVVLSVTTPIFLSGCQNGTIRFGLATDSHYADRARSGTRFYNESDQKLAEFVAEMNKENVDFIVHLGDFKDEDENKLEVDTLRYLKTVKDIFLDFNGPTYHCIGNHDVDSITKAQFLENVSNTGIPKDKSYYSFDVKGYHFIVLDANFHEDGRHHFYTEGDVDWQNTNIPAEEVAWLKEDLKKTALPSIVFCHHPLFQCYHNGHQYHVNKYKEIQRIFEESGKVMIVFQGHIHQERFFGKKGIDYVSLLGMVDYEGLENNSFSLVEINSQGVLINGYKRSKDMNFRD